MYKKLNIFVLVLIFCSFSAQQIDDFRYSNVLKQLNLDSSKIYESLSVEKKMPNADGSYIIVLPVFKEKVADDYFLIQNYILITDGKGKIKNQYFDPVEITSDAIMLESFTIDTGLYNLNSNIRAFGIIANFTGSSRPNPYSSSDISMYYPDGKTFKKILSKYNLYMSGGEWDMSCAGEFYDTNSVIILDKTKTNGFANFRIKTTSTETVSKEVNGECSEKKKSKTFFKTLKFDTSIYR